MEFQPADPFPAAALAFEYYEEARLCWFHGAFVATIVMSQLALEEMLRSHFRILKGVKGCFSDGKLVDNVGFARLSREARIEGFLSADEAEEFDRLRTSRNPYVHPHDTDPNTVTTKPDGFAQLAKITAPGLVGVDVETEAKESIRLLVTFFPSISKRQGGL